MSFFDENGASVIEDLPEALLVTSGEGQLLYVNRALTELTGFSTEELIGAHVTRLMPAGERRQLDVVSWFSRWAANPDVHQLRYLMLDGITKSGEQLKYRVRVSSFEKEINEKMLVCFLVIVQDNTADHQTVQDLRHAQLVSSRIIAIGEDAVLSIDESNNISFWNDKAESIFGYTRDEILGQPIDILIPDDLVETHRQHMRDFATSPQASKLMGNRAEIQGRHKHGRYLPLEASITKTTVDNQQIISAQIRDISTRKANENRLLQSEFRFRALFENARQAMVLLASDGRVLEINATASSWLQQNRDVKNEYFWQLDWWPTGVNDDIKATRNLLKQNIFAARTGTETRIRAQLATSSSQTDSARDIDFSLRPVADNKGGLAFIIAEGRDITGLGEL